MIDPTIQSKASIFPCDCGGEGIVVVRRDWEYNDAEVEGSPFIDMAFFGIANYSDGRLSWRSRLRWAWQIIRTGNPFEDMVSLRSNVARNLAYHILYLLSKGKQTKKQEDGLLVPLPDDTKVDLPSDWGKVK